MTQGDPAPGQPREEAAEREEYALGAAVDTAPGRRSTWALTWTLGITVAALAVGAGYWLGTRDSSREGVESSQAKSPRVDSASARATAFPQSVAATHTAIATRAAGATPSAGGLVMGVVQHGVASLGEPAPDFTLPSIDEGEPPVSLKDFRGQSVVLNFWATWCPPCRAEMPYLQAAQDRHAVDGLVVLAIDVQESIDLVLPYVVDVGLTLPVLLDEEGSVSDRYRVKTFPTTYLVDAQGVVTSIKRGAYRSQGELDEAVSRLLADSDLRP